MNIEGRSVKPATLILMLCNLVACGRGAAFVTTGPHSSDEVMHLGGAVRPSRINTSVDVASTGGSKAAHKSVSTQVYLWVEADGLPSHLQITRSPEMGAQMDERIADAVSQYRFKPATLNGRPVPVDLLSTSR